MCGKRIQRIAIDQFDGSGYDPSLNELGDRLDGVRNLAELGEQCRLGGRLRDESQRNFGDNRQRPLGTDEQLRQVVADDIFHCLRSRVDDFARRQNCFEREHVALRRPVLERPRSAGALRNVAADRTLPQAGWVLLYTHRLFRRFL